LLSVPGNFRRAATYVDKILKGANPADLPVEQPITVELIIHLKTAQVLGLTIPSTRLFQADEVFRSVVILSYRGRDAGHPASLPR
jgi:hypothetical protein